MTGAGSGIGRAVALALAREGAKVGLVGRTRAKLGEVEIEISSSGGEAVVAPADVTVPADVERAVREIASGLGRPTILVNNAGDARSAPFAKTTVEAWNEILAVNLTSAFLVTRAALPHFLEAGRGRIVNMASIAGLRGAAYVAAYTASKHGLVGLTRSLAVELASKNITVNAVCPGYVDTPMTDRNLQNIAGKTGMSLDDARAAVVQSSAQKRLITPDEVASAVVYLCLPESRGVNGQAIAIQGGEGFA